MVSRAIRLIVAPLLLFRRDGEQRFASFDDSMVGFECFFPL